MRKIVIFLIVLFWPLSLFLANTKADFFSYLLPVILILISYVAYAKQSKFYYIPLIFIPFIQPKLTLFPIIFLLLDLIIGKREKEKILFLTTAIAILFIKGHNFWGQTIFVPDYEARQEVIRETQLYPSIFLARTFHNKIRIMTDKFTYNFLALADPNNYFFGFAPRQTINNQNLQKYPFFGIVFVLYGLLQLNKTRDQKFIIMSFLTGILSLSVLTIFDRNDFILWIPVTLILIHGVNLVKLNFKLYFWLFMLFVIFTVPEVLRILVIYLK